MLQTTNANTGIASTPSHPASAEKNAVKSDFDLFIFLPSFLYLK
jgi:hypothetical protein